MAWRADRRKHLKPPVGSETGSPVMRLTYLAAERLRTRRESGQLMTRIPLQYREPTMRSASLAASKNRGISLGLWEKSPSISNTNS